MGGSINRARNFFIREKGLDANQADNLITQGLQAFNTITEPQSMMQMASNGGRIGYQVGGITSMPMDFGQPLQVPQQTSMPMQPIMSSPVANYGQTPLMMRGGGIARLGYQMGGEAMIQPQMNEEQALETIIQLLIQQGIDPETALQLAAQILQIFAQGGEPAVEAFANQLEQQEQVQEMAGGGIAGLYPRQGYFVGKIVKGITGAVKGVAKAVKSVAKSPIGRIALTIGANMLLPGAGTAFGAALKAAAINLGVQAIGGGKINPLEALAAGATGYIGFGGPGSLSGDTSTISQGGLTDAQLQAAGQTSNFGSTVNVPLNQIQPVDIPLDTGSYAGSVQNITNQGITAKEFTSPLGTLSDYQGIQQGSPLSMSGPTIPKPGYSESVKAVAKDPSLSGIKYLATEGLSNIGTGVSEFVQKNPKTALAGAFATGLGSGIAFGAPQQPEESNEDFAKRQQDEANLSLTQFGRNLQIRNPFFYARYEAVNPFAEQAAQGGIMGYAAGGSMIPPARRIEGGVIELDARKTGGYIPYGKKERVDDVPAMLAKDEFVFTSRAVKGAGDGSARRGAAKMYKLMKQLEAKGKKMERQGARA